MDFCEQNFINNFTVDFTVYENKWRTRKITTLHSYIQRYKHTYSIVYSMRTDIQSVI